MKKIILFVSICFTGNSCSNENITSPDEFSEPFNFLTNESDINKIQDFIKSANKKEIYSEFKSIRANSSLRLKESRCYFELDNNGNDFGDDNYINSDPHINSRNFTTLLGDMYIENEFDLDAVRRVYYTGDIYCNPYYIEENSRKNYINLIINDNVTTFWRTAIDLAINAWNSELNVDIGDFYPLVGNDYTGLYFRIVDEVNEDDYGNINVRMEELNSNTASATIGVLKQEFINNFPVVNHIIGGNLRIDPDFETSNLDRSVTFMVHELGHNIGFRHTNQTISNIAGTNYQQGDISFMNHNASYTWSSVGFSVKDKIAIDLVFNREEVLVLETCFDDFGNPITF